jgi:hypothetical protein
MPLATLFLRATVACAAVLAFIAGAAAALGAQLAEDGRLAEATRVLEHQVALAGGKDFYLLVEPSRSAMTLFLKGASLQEYRLESLEVGRRRWAFLSRGGDEDWAGVVWRAGALEPDRVVPRLEIVPGVEASVPPLLPEEQIVAPPAYRIRFEDGLVVDVRAERPADAGGLQGLSRAASSWWSDFRAAVWGRADDRVRLRLTLSAADAESLYRALPPGTALLIVPPGVDLSRAAPAKPAPSKGGRSRS